MQGTKQNRILQKLLSTGKMGDSLESFGTQLSSVSEREWNRLSEVEEAAEELWQAQGQQRVGKLKCFRGKFLNPI